MEYYIGKLIRSIRKERDIKDKHLVNGLVGTTKINRIETGEVEPGKWLSDVLLERLGVSANKFGCLFLDEELESYELRRELLQQLSLREWHKAAQAYKEFYQQVKDIKESSEECPVLQEQFLRFINLLAYYSEGMRRSFVKVSTDSGRFFSVTNMAPYILEKHIRDTLELTVPGFDETNIGQYLLGRIERALVAMLADVLTVQKRKTESGIALFKEILSTMENQIVDEEELRYQYPRIASLAVRAFAAMGHYEDWVSSKGKEVLLRNRRVKELDTFLRYERMIAEHNGDYEKIMELDKELRLLEEIGIGDTKGEDWKEQKLHVFLELAEASFSGVSIGARMYRARKELDLTQKKLAEGICDFQCISRFERGSSKIHTKTLQLLLEKLGQGSRRYFSEIVSNDYRIHECYRKMAACMAVMDYEQAEKLYNVLEYSLDKNEKVNRQTLLTNHTIIECGRGRIDSVEAERRYRESLHISVPEKVQIENWPLVKAETVLLNSIANELSKMGKDEEAASLLRKVILSCEKYHGMSEENNSQYMLTLYNLSSYVSRLGLNEEAYELSKRGMEFGVLVGEGESIVEFMYKIAWNMEHLYDTDNNLEMKEACLKMLRQAHGLAKLISYRTFKEHIARHCKKTYNIDF